MAEVRLSGKFGLVWMDPDRGINKFILFSEFYGAVQRAGTVSRADRKDVSYSHLLRASDHLLAIRVEAWAIKMRMGINEHEQ